MMPQSSIARGKWAAGEGGRLQSDGLLPGEKMKGARQEAISARVLYFGSAGPSAETALALDVAGRTQIHRITDDYIAYVDDGHAFYNTIFIVGNDAARIRKFMRFYRPVLKHKARIVLIRATRPRVRAQLLNAGFDEVFEPDMPVPEATARVRAILTRLALNQQSKVADDVRDLHLQHFARAPLLGREARVLAMLVAAQGSPVRSQQLATSSKSTHRPIGTKSLQVLISGLRGKLKHNLQIVSHGPSGYSLQETSLQKRLLKGGPRQT